MGPAGTGGCPGRKQVQAQATRSSQSTGGCLPGARGTVLFPPAQTAGEWPACPPARLPSFLRQGQAPWLRDKVLPRTLAPPSEDRRTPPVCQSSSFVSDPCPAGQSSQPHGVWASPLQSGELALPQQRSSVDRGPLTHPGGGGTQSQIHDRHRNNKFIIRTTEDTVMHIQKEGTSLQQRASWPTPQQEPTVSQNAGSEDSILTRAGPVPNTQTAPGAIATQAPCSRGPQRRAGSRPGGRRGGEALQPAPSPGAPRPWSGNAACIFRASYVLHVPGNGRRLSGTHTHQGSRRTPWCQVDTGPAEDSSPQAQGWGVAGVSPLMEVCGWSRGGRKAEELT